MPVLDPSLVLAGLGGVAINLLNLMELQHVPTDRRPDFKDWLYWLPFAVWPFLAAFVAYVYQHSGSDLTPIMAVHLGASAPLILKGMAGAVPPRTQINPGPGA